MFSLQLFINTSLFKFVSFIIITVTNNAFFQIKLFSLVLRGCYELVGHRLQIYMKSGAVFCEKSLVKSSSSSESTFDACLVAKLLLLGPTYSDKIAQACLKW